jgi:hypothetical protein
MATTISASFQTLKENIEITGLQKTTVSTRQQNVRQAVESELTVLDSFLTGSYARNTLISPLTEADVDIFIVLSSAYYNNYTPESLLDKVKAVLLKTYPTTPKISRNGQAVTITFADFQVDVVPAFNRQGGGYLIPNSITKGYISTNPKTHVDLMTSENQAHRDDLVPLIKMIKAWNKNVGQPFVSFYLELMTMKILKGIRIDDFSSGVRYVFDKGREAIKFTITDPVGYGGEVKGFQNISTVADAVSRFETAFGRAAKAEQYALSGYVRSAVDEWRKIFGDYFPTYG